MTQKNELPSWVCQACEKLHYEDLKETDYKCTECGAGYSLVFEVTETVYNDDGTFTDEVIYQTETVLEKSDGKENS